MTVYDDEKIKSDEIGDEQLRQITGISPDEEGAMDREALKGAEEDGGIDSSATGDAPETAKEQSALGNDQVGGGYNPDDTGRFGKLGGRFSRRKKIIGGGIAGTIIAGSIIFSIGQGPFQIIHFGQL